MRPCPRAHEGALAGAGFAEDQHLLARLDHGLSVADEDAAVTVRDRQALQREAGIGALQALDAADRVEALVEFFRRLDEGHDAARRGVPHGDELVAVDEPGEGDLDLEERRRELRHGPERQLAREIFWSRQ
jgi:hypothetical protein